MKKFITAFTLTFFALVWLSAFTLIHVPENNADNSNLKAAMLNCKPGVFKTYDDFVNNKPLPWKWETQEIKYSSGYTKISKYEVVFKDENGQKQKLSPSEFWGWRNEERELWRNGEFISGNITAVPFYVSYVTRDYVLYHPTFSTYSTIEPNEWCSANMNSPIMDNEAFFKTHSKTTYNKIIITKEDCAKSFRNAPRSKAREDCMNNIAEILIRFKPDKEFGLKGMYVDK